MNSSPSQQTIRVLIADDHVVFREGIRAVLGGCGHIEVVAEAGNGQEAIEQFLRHQPDVTVMDLQMPLMGGVDATIAIRSLSANARILALTTFAGDATIGRALRAGASGYLLKGTLRNELIKAIENVHAGVSHIQQEAASELEAHKISDVLSIRELEVLRMVAQGNANKEVGRQLAIKEETVKAHMSTILSKLGANDRTHAVTIAIRRGIIEI